MWDEGDVTVSYSSSMMTASRRELKQLYAEDTVKLTLTRFNLYQKAGKEMTYGKI